MLNRIINFTKRKLKIIITYLEKIDYNDDIYFTENQKLINIGAGYFSHPNWINLEYSTDWYDDLPQNFISYNLVSGDVWPLSNDSVDAYYCSHVIEHIDFHDVERLVKNAYNSLKKGGALRITCPDTSALYDACLNNDYSFFSDQIEFYSKQYNYKHQYKASLENAHILDLLVDVIATQKCSLRINVTNTLSLEKIKLNFEKMKKIEFLDWLTSDLKFSPERAGEHITWWDYDKLSQVCIQSGFSKIKKCGYLQSKLGAMRIPNLFDGRHPHKSFYLECYK